MREASAEKDSGNSDSIDLKELQKVFSIVGIALIGTILAIFIVLGCNYIIGKPLVPRNHVQNN